MGRMPYSHPRDPVLGTPATSGGRTVHRSAMPLGSLIAALAVLAGSLVATAAPASAAGGRARAGSILVIMDVSGSMERKDARGTKLIDGARQAVRRLVAEAPPKTPVGLRLYGQTYRGASKGPGCRDTRLVVPIAPLSASGRSINAAVGRATPTGFTPIGYSLQQAAKDFPPEGQRTIVLVSDGEDTCGNPAPCTIARRLNAKGIDVRVDTVGLFLQGNQKARRQLQCVAAATGGRYYPADDTAALTDRLTTASQRAVARFRASGREVDGGPAATQATAVRPRTDYVDDLRPGEARFYSFPAGTGQVVDATLTEDGAVEYNCCLKLSVLDPDFDSVANDSEYNPGGTAKTLHAASDDQGVADTGSYLVEVSLDKGAARRPVRYQFKVGVSGTALEFASPSPTASATPSTEASPSPSASPTGQPADQSAGRAATPDQGGGSGLLWGLLAALLVLVLLAVAAVGVALVRLRRPGGNP